VTLLDANVLLIDFKYNNDPNFARTRQAMTAFAAANVPLAVPTQVMIEVVGVLSFGTPAADVPNIWPTIRKRYALATIPDPARVPNHCGCTPDEIIARMVKKMAAGDAVIAAQVEKFAPGATAFLTWNLKHFRGNLVIPVLTPEEWLLQQPPPAAPAPPPGPTP
jgi:hypothetical protein